MAAKARRWCPHGGRRAPHLQAHPGHDAEDALGLAEILETGAGEVFPDRPVGQDHLRREELAGDLAVLEGADPLAARHHPAGEGGRRALDG
jgi:hypothetical protein